MRPRALRQGAAWALENGARSNRSALRVVNPRARMPSGGASVRLSPSPAVPDKAGSDSVWGIII
eukprot:354921-Chlamydomonas_euryale.AAC.8